MLTPRQIVVATLLGLLVALCAWGRIPRHWVALGIAIALLATGCLSPTQFLEGVDWDVIGLVLGMSIMTAYLELSGAMDLAARALLKRVASPRLLLFTLLMAAGCVSIALENVSVTLLFAPIGTRIAGAVGLDVVYTVVGVALASNLAGSATMIGDPPAIITAGYFNLAFTDFIVYRGRPSMFFYTLAAMILACLSISLSAPRSPAFDKNRVTSVGNEGVPTLRNVDRLFVLETLAFLSVKIALLSVRHVIRIPLSLAAAVAVGGTSMARLAHRDVDSVRKALREGLDWRVALFLVGVFSLSKAFQVQGLAKLLATWMLSFAGADLFATTTMLVWVSVLASAFIDNVPYTATMLPVVSYMASRLHLDPVLLAWAMLLGTTLGGNLTYIGASANVVAVRLLEKKGLRVSFLDFLRVSSLFNTVSVVSGWLMYELVWGFL